MSGSEELAQAEEEQVEGGEEYEGNEDDQELAAMQKELEKAEQQKAELDKLNKMQGGASADSKQSESSPCLFPPRLSGPRPFRAGVFYGQLWAAAAWPAAGAMRGERLQRIARLQALTCSVLCGRRGRSG